MDYKYKFSEPIIIEKTKTKQLSEDELAQIKEDFFEYLKHSPFGTIETYPERELIKAVMKHYPRVIPEYFGKRYTRERTNELMEENLMCVATNKKIKNGVPHIQFCMNYINGKEDQSYSVGHQQIIINSKDLEATFGKITLPEPKEGRKEN
jgi:hypothetical protein